MEFDVTIFPDDLNHAANIARRVEDYGFNGLWTAEATHNPFLPLTHAAAATKKITLGTAIAVAFPRSPMLTAQISRDLAVQSKGRFILGLGTQVKAHITKRFSTDWTPPVPRLREYVQSLRAIWDAFQSEGPLKYSGENYNFSLITPFFSPGPTEFNHIPVYIAGVNKGLCSLAGELCDGLHVHPFHTVKYVKEMITPAVEEGGDKTGRTREDVAFSSAIFVVTGRDAESMQQTAIEAKSQIAFYASTPSYRVVLDMHGWGDLGDKLNEMVRQGKWMEMWKEISDEMLNEFAVVGTPDELPYKARERYDGILDRMGFYFPFRPEEEDRRIIWEHASRAMNNA